MSTMAETTGAGAQPEQRINTAIVAMVLFITSEAMVFGALFAAYFFIRAQAASWPPPGAETLARAYPTVNTIILLLSGVTMHLAHMAIRRDDRRLFLRLTVVTILLGAAFISGQGWEYAHVGFSPEDGTFGTTFFTMTGLHGAHVILGLGLLVLVAMRGLLGDFTGRRHLLVEASSMYWHFVDIVWVFLFAILYWSQ